MPKLLCDGVGFGEIVAELPADPERAPLVEAAASILANVGMEADPSARGVIFRGKFQEADALNKNKRIYPRSVLESAIEYVRDAIQERRLIGELDHPDTPTVKWKEASHLITKLWWEGNCLMGEGETLPTPWGMVLESVLKRQIRVGISSRGVGDGRMTREGLVITPGFKMVTWDVVVDPSTREAFLEQTDHEAKVEKKEETQVESTQGQNPKNEAICVDRNDSDQISALVATLIRSKFLHPRLDPARRT